MRREIAIFLASLVSIILILSIAVSIVHLLGGLDADLEIGTIRIYINGRTAELSADVNVEPEPDSADLRMVLDSQTIDLDYSSGRLSAELNEMNMRSLLERDHVDIIGSAGISFGPFPVKGDIKERVNVSFIKEMAASLNVSNVNITFTFTGTTLVDFNIESDIERDFILQVNNTPAKLISPGGRSFDCTILELDYRSGKVGTAKASIPALGALGLALYARNITIDIWGIQAEIPIPLFNG